MRPFTIFILFLLWENEYTGISNTHSMFYRALTKVDQESQSYPKDLL